MKMEVFQLKFLGFSDPSAIQFNQFLVRVLYLTGQIDIKLNRLNIINYSPFGQ